MYRYNTEKIAIEHLWRGAIISRYTKDETPPTMALPGFAILNQLKSVLIAGKLLWNGLIMWILEIFANEIKK